MTYLTGSETPLQHHNLWHRGTKELLGQRRIMLKLLFDRTDEPSAPSWNHTAMPLWDESILQSSPWLPTVFEWMCGRPCAEEPPPDRLLDHGAVDALVAQLLSRDERDDGHGPRERARAAYSLGRFAPASCVGRLLELLSASISSTSGVAVEGGHDIGSHWRAMADAPEIRLATAIAALRRPLAASAVRRRLSELGSSSASSGASFEQALLLDVLLDCPRDGADTIGRQVGTQALCSAM